MTTVVERMSPPRPSLVQLLRVSGGTRYSVAVLVSALGGGLLRPFMVLYAITISHLSVGAAGVALSAGFLAGLAFIPLMGRWLDRGARTAPVVVTLLTRVAGLVLLVAVAGPVGFVGACIVLPVEPVTLLECGLPE